MRNKTIKKNKTICANCIYWELQEPKDDPILKEHNLRIKPDKIYIRGKCRRYPPQLNNQYIISFYPRTEDKDWCGEFSKR